MFYDGLSSDSDSNISESLDKLKDLYVAANVEEFYDLEPMATRKKQFSLSRLRSLDHNSHDQTKYTSNQNSFSRLDTNQLNDL